MWHPFYFHLFESDVFFQGIGGDFSEGRYIKTKKVIFRAESRGECKHRVKELLL